MPLLFLAAVIGIPVLEIYTFIEVGGEIGALSTILLTIFTAIAGMALLRQQGVSVLMQAQATLQKGESPINEILNGILLAIAGLFLLIPGFVTDAVGFLLFLPPLRTVISRWLGKNTTFSGRHSHTHYQTYGRNKPSDPTIIDGDFEIVDDENTPKPSQDILEEQGSPPNSDSPWSKNKDS